MTCVPNSIESVEPLGAGKEERRHHHPTDAELGELLDACDRIGHLLAERCVDLDLGRVATS